MKPCWRFSLMCGGMGVEIENVLPWEDVLY